MGTRPRPMAVRGDEMNQVPLQEAHDHVGRLPSVDAGKAAAVRLGEGAHPDEVEEQAGILGEYGIPLRMRYNGLNTFAHQVEKQILDSGIDVLGGKFDEHVGTAIQSQAFSVIFNCFDQIMGDMDFCAEQHLDPDFIRFERPAEVIELLPYSVQLLDRIIAAEQMRRGHDRLNAIVSGNKSHLHGLFERLGPVIESGQNMAMEVNHAVKSTSLGR